MSDMFNIILLDNSNKIIEETKMIKPKLFNELKSQLYQTFNKLPNHYIIFHLDENNNECIINDMKTYDLSKDILFIREINDNDLNKSIFEINYQKLSESKKEILDYKYNCFICSDNIKNENPLFCYKCQKIFHGNCLIDWDLKKKIIKTKFRLS